MKIEDYKGGKLIILSKAFDNRSKILNCFYFLVFLAACPIFLFIIYDNPDVPWPGILIAATASLASLIAAYRFGNKTMYSEKLFINKNVLQHIQQGFSKTVHSYDTSKISNFRHLDKPILSKHPLAGETFDYMGFQTEQKVINEMHGDKRIAFDYNGLTITFGENIFSWDFDQLEILLYDITGNDFRYTDEYEKKNSHLPKSIFQRPHSFRLQKHSPSI